MAQSMTDLTDAWIVLQETFPLAVIHNEKQYNEQKLLADMLSDQVGDDSTHPLFSLFEIVLVLIETWEKAHVSIPDAEPKEVLRFLMRDHGLRQKDLVDIMSPSLISDILAGRRAISKKMAVKLSRRFNVGVSAFI